MTIQIPDAYRAIFTNDYRFFCYYGGRGGGKSFNIALCLILLAAKSKLRILCIREVQKSINESVKSTLEDWISRLNLHNEFEITQYSIKSRTGSEFLFMGMQSWNSVNVKSIANIDITWIEEASAFSKKSWQLLVPSVTRTKYPKILISFNPDLDSDIIYQEFIAQTPPRKSFVKKLNYYDNPFFANTELEQIMLNDKERLPAHEFAHIWLGELASFNEDSLFKDCDFMPITPIPLQDYARIVISCDPATTNNKDFSNEFGVIVVALRKDGFIDILDDYSANFSPIEFAKAVIQAKELYKTNEVVVEVNQGGDFLKATLIQADPLLKVIEVRASTDKVHRALPVANLMQQRKIRLTKPLPKLTRQMRLITTNGFKGAEGESPDRLDAFVWGVIELAQIQTLDTIQTLIKPQWLETNHDYCKSAIIACKGAWYVSQYADQLCAIQFDLFKNVLDFRIKIRALSHEMPQDSAQILIEDKPLNEHLLQNATQLYTSTKHKDLDKAMLIITPLLKQGRIFVECSEIRRELMHFKLETKAKSSILKLFCDIVINEFALPKE